MWLACGHPPPISKRAYIMEQPNLANLRSTPLKRLVSDENKLGDEFSGHLAVRFLDEHRAGADMETPGQRWRKHMVWGVALLCRSR
jgi:hypothetical protein